jgi:hypothetical protein
MNVQKCARLMYRFLLRLHPAGFRRRFEEEMLWIFDLSSSCTSETAYLLYDGVCSVLVQHAKFDRHEEPPAAFCLEVRRSGLTLARVSQATVLGGAILLALASILAQEMPPQSVFNQNPTCQHFDEPQPQAHLEIKR